MKQNTVLIVAVALLALGIIGYLIVSSSDSGDMNGMMHGQEEHSAVSNDNNPMNNSGLMNDGMSGMDHSMMDHSTMMVTSEREFLTGMIPHHQEAVDTAKEVLERGGSTEGVRELAANIITAQELEIALMKEWYLEWYGEEYQDTQTYEPMMRELENLSGAELDAVFLEDMIMHHMGAIMMAQSVQPHVEHQEITDLVVAINTTQSKEIELMRELLTELE